MPYHPPVVLKDGKLVRQDNFKLLTALLTKAGLPHLQ